MSIGKMSKHKGMSRHSVLRRHLPETHWLSPARTKKMIRSYKSIFIKPNHGSGGRGIIKAKRLKKGYEVRSGSKRRYVKRSHSVYKAVKAYRKRSNRYIVQRGIKLGRYHGSIFDVRVYMQKPPGKKWTISGVTARVAAKHKYVTNYHQGGYGKPLGKVLLSLFKSKTKARKCLKKIVKLSFLMAATINKQHAVRELGIDLAVEKSGRIWIIEANSKPGHKLFKQLPDKKMLWKILINKRRIYGS